MHLEEGLRHDRGVVVSDLPLSVLVGVNVSVTGLDLVASGTHGELVDSSIEQVVVTLDDLGLEENSLRLLLQEVNEVGLDGVVVHARGVRDGGEEDGVLGVTSGDSVGVEGGEGIVPEVEDLVDFGISHVLRGGHGALLDGERGQHLLSGGGVQAEFTGGSGDELVRELSYIA